MAAAIQEKIDNLNKPKGSLGRLEELALQVCLVQQSLTPSLAHPCHLLLGADHGIEREGVSVSPREVTWQQMINFAHGGGAVNMFCRQHRFKLRIVDVGVDHDFSETAILNRKIAHGTQNFLYGPAMSHDEYHRAIRVGSDLADDCWNEGCRVLSIGEMGIANTSPSSLWMHLLAAIPLSDCIGAGAGLDSPGVLHKYAVLSRAVEGWRSRRARGSLELGTVAPGAAGASSDSCSDFPYAAGTSSDSCSESPYAADSCREVLRYFGGFEMVAAVGAMLRAAEHRIVVLVDGFIMTACALAAMRLYPAVADYMVFTHCGDESGHQRMLQAIGAKPLLQLGLRLGEGTGALCAFPIVDSAVRMVNEMNNFQNANITKYF